MAADYLFTGMVFTFVGGMIFMLLGFENRESKNLSAAINVVAYHFLASIMFFLLSQLFLMAYGATTTFVLPIWMLFLGFGLINFALFMALTWQVFAVAWSNYKRSGSFRGKQEEEVE